MSTFKYPIAKRLDGVSESATLKLNAMVTELKKQGRDIVNLTAGEPDFSVPTVVQEAMMQAVRDQKSKYTPVAGIVELRKKIAERTNHDQPSLAREKPWTESDVLVTNGGKQAIYNFLMAVVDAGDEVLIPSPFWLSYPEMVRLAGGTPKLVSTTFANHYRLTPADLEAAIGPRTRALILNSPSNPTGSMYSKKELRALGEVLLKSKHRENIWILSDEIYDRIILGDVPFCSFGEAVPELREQLVTVTGLSKSAAMTGWRMGWSVASKPVTQAMATLQGQSTSGINAPTQWAALAALGLKEEVFAEFASIFKRRKGISLEVLSRSGKLKWVDPDGAFYLFIQLDEVLREGEDSFGFAERLLSDAGVAVVPGGPFGAPKAVRMSFATDDKTLREGVERIVRYTG